MSDEGQTTVLSTIGPATEAMVAEDAGVSSETSAGEPDGADGASPLGAVPEPPKADPRIDIAKRFDQIAKRESRTRREREAFENERRSFTAEREAIAKEREAFKADLELFRSDPVAYELKAGRDPVEAVRRFAQPETETDKAIRELRDKLAARDKADEENQTRAQKRAEQAEHFRSLQGFVGQITPDECPAVTTLYPADAVPGLVDEMLGEKDASGVPLLERFRDAHGRNPTHKEIREALEEKAKVRATHLYESLKRIFSAQQATSASSHDQTVNGPSLSNQHAGKIVSPNGSRVMTLDERRAAALTALKSQLESEQA